ncbi:MAG: hypothetical protein NTV51_17940 [Verrucomicrobia bacterium]|nr:hypothetical protein [Verrucomicrobiota bacterium]
MKTILICPAIRPAVPQLAEDAPLVLAPILGECLVVNWVEHVASLGATQVRVVAADRADAVRAVLGDGARWGVQLEVIALNAEPTLAEAAVRFQPPGMTGWLPAPHAIVLMNHLPDCPDLPLFDSYASWFAALLAWVPRALTPSRVRVSEISPGVWVGRRAHVSEKAVLIAPCWVGDQVFVEPGAIVGPGAILEDRSVIEEDARVTHSWVGPDTFVGPMTAISTSLAGGSTLTNWRSDSSLRVPDPFLMCSLAPSTAVTAIRQLARNLVAPARRAQVNWIPAWPLPPQRAHESNPPV